MAIHSYTSFRILANPGGTLDLLGLPEWPAASMRSGGFDGGFDVATGPTGMTVTCNALAADAVAGVDEFDWFFSQGVQGVDGNFAVSRADNAPDTNSGSINVEYYPAALDEFPDPYDLSAIQVLFFQVHAYVRRRSDGAIQRLDLLAHLTDALTPKTDVE